MNIKLYVEGGGDRNKALQTQCRRGFSEFIRRAGMEGRMPRVIACGGRRQAYDSFRTAHDAPHNLSYSILLVDSEGLVNAVEPWEHVRQRTGDGWERPRLALDDQLHFMAQAMEAWFHADKDALRRYFGQQFREAAVSARSDVENVPKPDLFSGLHEATRRCEKGAYSKGEHSFQVLARIDPAKVRAASPHADRFLRILDRVSDQ